MADRRRIVTFSPGGRPVVELDLETGSAFQAIRETFAYQPGANGAMASREPGRYGGQAIVGEQNDNGTVSWQALVRGSTADQVAANIETLLSSTNRSTPGRRLEWRPDGSTFSSFFRVAGPATVKPTYKWAQWQGAQSMVVDVSFPVRPLVDWDPMTIIDPFDVDSLADYTQDGPSQDMLVSLGTVIPSGAFTTERRVRHVVRGYKHREGQATLATKVGATVTGFKAGVILQADGANVRIEAYVDDNGTNSRVRVDTVDLGGTRTNRASTNLGARLSTNTSIWVRGRIEGQVATVELFTSAPSPMGTPAATDSWSDLGVLTNVGYAGFVWIPASGGSLIDQFEFRPFTYRNQTLPKVIQPRDTLPGAAPALMDVIVTPSGGTDKPVWAKVAWARMLANSTSSPIGVFDAESMSLTGWASSVQGGSRGGNDARATTSGVGTFTAALDLTQVSYIGPDEFSDRVDVEVWARVIVSAGNVNPRIRVQAGPYSAGSGIVAPVDTIEYGAAGKLIIEPSTGTVYRYVRLGTIVGVDPRATATRRFLFTGTVDAGSSGAFGLDYIELNPARRRAANITGVAASEVTPFVPSNGEWTKRIASDLTATLEGATFGIAEVQGVGGSLIQPDSGGLSASPYRLHVLAKLSSLVPDDPTSDATTEQLAHAATVSLDVTPRSYLMRSA